MGKKGKNIEANSEAIKKEKYIPKFQHIFNKKWTDNEINSLADEMLEWFESPYKNSKNEDVTRLWLKDFAITKRITPQRISEFKERSEYFLQIYTLCNQIQESRLFTLGLKVKSAMPIFALKNIAGWSEKSEINVKELPKVVTFRNATTEDIEKLNGK